VLGRAAAVLLAPRHAGRARLGLPVRRRAALPLLRLRPGQCPAERLGPRRARVLPHRHGAFRPGDHRRVHRAHQRAGEGPAALPRRRGAGEARLTSAAVVAVVFAYHDVGVRCLQVLLEQGVDVPLVVTHRDDPAEAHWFASVAALARERGIETLEDPGPAQIREKLAALPPDLIFSFYYRRMLPPEWLAAARRGAFNMHGSLLPKYRGRAPVNWAVLMGEAETGATLHEMVAKPDAGRIVDRERVAIGEDETAVEVFRKVTAAAQTVLRRSLPRLVAGDT